MAIDDLWYLKKKGPNGKRMKSARFGRGKRWRVRVPGHRTEAFDLLKEEAEPRETALLNANLTGTALDRARGDLTVEEYFREWRSTTIFGPTTEDIVDRIYRLHVIPTLGGVPMASIAEVRRLQPWIKELSLVQAPQSVWNIWQQFSSMLRFAVDDKAIHRLPKIKLPELDRALKDVPTTHTVQMLERAASKELKPPILLAAGCGLRAGEIFGLEPDCFSSGMVEVRQQIRKIGSGPFYLGPPKTKASYRTVDVPDVVDEAIQEVKPTKVVLWDRTNPRKPVEREAWMMFVTPRKRTPYRAGSWDGAIKTAGRAAGIEQGMYFHLLRHYFATFLIAQGASVKQIQTLLGHKDATTTLNTYAGYWPETSADTATLLSAALRV